ncbi:MAG: exodeoxyribonuclease VII small subunit [Christensenellaceae bacterium]|jgi:exodeoxyribonuclease VII small subunit
MAKQLEDYLEELKEISEKLGDGNIRLAEAVSLYKKGSEIAQKAEKMLNQVESEIEIVGEGSADTDG